MLTAKKIYLDRDGNVCERSDPNCKQLLIGAEQRIPDHVAEELGILNDPEYDLDADKKAHDEAVAAGDEPPAGKDSGDANLPFSEFLAERGISAGIAPAIAEAFPTLKAIKDATDAELGAIKGVGRAAIKKLRELEV